MKGLSVGKRTGSLVLAVALAALASVALVSYVNGLEEKAFAGVETIEVYVAKTMIPAGTTAEEAAGRGAFDRTRVPRKVVAAGAVTSLEQVRGRVADVNILPGEQIVTARFVEPERAGSILPIPADRQAVTVSVEVPPGIGGFVQPGDHVSLIGKFDLAVAQSGQWKNVKNPVITRFVLQDIPVLAVGPRVAGAQTPQTDGDRAKAKEDGGNQSLDRVMLTLAVRPVDAEKVAYVAFSGQMWFTLLPRNQAPIKTAGRHALNIFS